MITKNNNIPQIDFEKRIRIVPVKFNDRKLPRDFNVAEKMAKHK